MEAAMEAPFVYAALDALASRAASWAERRQRRLLESAPPAVVATMQEPEEAASMMAAAVKKVQMVIMPGILPSFYSCSAVSSLVLTSTNHVAIEKVW
jgi:hypothetical protein